MPTRTEQKIWYLKQIFHGSDDLIRDIERVTHMQDMSKNQLIAGPEINCGKIFILKKGSVNVYQVYNGKKIILDTLAPGDIFGDIRNVGNQNAPSDNCREMPFVEAREDSIISIAQSRDIYRIMQKYPDVAISLLQNLSNQLLRAESKIQDLALRSVSERIVRELSRIAEKTGENLPDRYVIDHPITHEQLAMMVGATRETVTKALSSLRSRGLVNIQNNKYSIFKQIAQPSFRTRVG